MKREGARCFRYNEQWCFQAGEQRADPERLLAGTKSALMNVEVSILEDVTDRLW